jgi:predicted thioesterase
VSHIAATPIGMWVDITVTVNSVDGRAVTMEINAQDPVEQVCRGSHSRFIVDVEKTIERLRKKVDAVEAA